MRRSTAAAVGTLTGAALILAVRLSVAPQPLAAPPAGFDLPEAGQGAAAAGAKPAPKPSASRSRGARDADGDGDAGRSASGLRDGQFTGTPVTHQYGTVQVSIIVVDGKITAAGVKAPNEGNSAVINANAVPKLKEETLTAQSAKIDAVSGATLTSSSYVTSLQAAIDSARA